MIELKYIGKVGKKPHIWIDVAGYITTQTALAEIFEINLITLRARLASGWPLSAALIIPATNEWSAASASDSAKLPAYEYSVIMTLYRHFKYPTIATYPVIIQGVK